MLKTVNTGPEVRCIIYFTGLYPWTDILMKQIMIEGIIVSRWEDKMPDAVKQLAEWVKQVRQTPKTTNPK